MIESSGHDEADGSCGSRVMLTPMDAKSPSWNASWRRMPAGFARVLENPIREYATWSASSPRHRAGVGRDNDLPAQRRNGVREHLTAQRAAEHEIHNRPRQCTRLARLLQPSSGLARLKLLICDLDVLALGDFVTFDDILAETSSPVCSSTLL
jgi:hypothetical protein